MSFVATKQVMPLYPLLGSIYPQPEVSDGKRINETKKPRTLAKMRKISASYEFVIHIFEPLSIHKSPSFLARVWSANASEPEAGSDKQKEPSYSAGIRTSLIRIESGAP